MEVTEQSRFYGFLPELFIYKSIPELRHFTGTPFLAAKEKKEKRKESENTCLFLYNMNFLFLFELLKQGTHLTGSRVKWSF